MADHYRSDNIVADQSACIENVDFSFNKLAINDDHTILKVMNQICR